MHKLVEGLLARDLRDVRFSIRDADTILYDEHGAQDPDSDPSPLFSEVAEMEIYGRNWRIDLRSDTGFRQGNSQSKPTIILLAGLLIEGFIVALLVMMARANRRAVTYADKVTQDLQAGQRNLAVINAKLAEKNAELEQYAYVASHGLKTPIRGIGGLTEMIEEDLEEYFTSPGANADVSQNLRLIHDRVNRMSQLTQGILSLSQADSPNQKGDMLCLIEAAAALRADFGLNAQQLVLAENARLIDVDTISFRRILENLVGNAVKYHDGARPLLITITATREGPRCHIRVTDNGPGIDLQYHRRIFDVFQTLHARNATQSTGIGLAIVKKLVSGHGGTIAVDSSVGTGAAFCFDWPAGIPQPQRTAAVRVA